MASYQIDLSKHPATADGSSHDSDSSGKSKWCVPAMVPDENCAGEEKVKDTSALDRSPQKVKEVSSAEEILKADESAISRVSSIKLTTGQDFVATAAACDSESETSHIHRSTSSKQDDDDSTFDPLSTVHSLQFWEPLVCELHELTKDGYNKSDSNEILETVFKKMEELREGFLSLADKIAKLQAEKIAANCGFMTSMARFMAQVYKGKLLIVMCANIRICDHPRQNQPYCAGPQSDI